jgi:hypothetical protein
VHEIDNIWAKFSPEAKAAHANCKDRRRNGGNASGWGKRMILNAAKLHILILPLF